MVQKVQQFHVHFFILSKQEIQVTFFFKYKPYHYHAPFNIFHSCTLFLRKMSQYPYHFVPYHKKAYRHQHPPDHRIPDPRCPPLKLVLC